MIEIMIEILIKTKDKFVLNKIELIIYAKNLIIFFIKMTKTINWCRYINWITKFTSRLL